MTKEAETKWGKDEAVAREDEATRAAEEPAAADEAAEDEAAAAEEPEKGRRGRGKSSEE